MELLLGQGEQRLRLAGDLDGARRAYALAGGVLEGIDDPAYLNLRQALVQERAALDALGADPRRWPKDNSMRSPRACRAGARIRRPDNDACSRGGGARSHGSCEVQPSGTRDRGATAWIAPPRLPRCNWNSPWRAPRSSVATSAAIGRRAGPCRRLAAPAVPDSPALRRQRAQLRHSGIAAGVRLPVLGSTRQQLQAMRAAH